MLGLAGCQPIFRGVTVGTRYDPDTGKVISIDLTARVDFTSKPTEP